MNRKLLLIFGIGVLASGLVLGGMYAMASKPSDVGQPESTPEAHTVRYHVVGTSMEPTIIDGDWLLARTDAKAFKAGDIVIMQYPKDETKVYCRRVVAVGGDKVVMRYYSNVKITTVYSAAHPEGVQFPADATGTGNVYGEYTTEVPSGSLYVVGDNAAPGGSFDSDEWGTLPVGKVAGLVSKRLSPNPAVFN